jgi:hypothetical protein
LPAENMLLIVDPKWFRRTFINTHVANLFFLLMEVALFYISYHLCVLQHSLIWYMLLQRCWPLLPSLKLWDTSFPAERQRCTYTGCYRCCLEHSPNQAAWHPARGFALLHWWNNSYGRRFLFFIISAVTSHGHNFCSDCHNYCY